MAFFVIFLALLFSFEALSLTKSDYESGRKVIQVQPGNVNASQPSIPPSALRRGGFEQKYVKILSQLKSPRNQYLIKHIKSVAKKYQIDPIHIVGAIVGEHTYNIDSLDRFQTYAVKALAWMNESRLTFRCKRCGFTLEEFLALPDVRKCESSRSKYDYWSCVEQIWVSDYRGKNGHVQTTFTENFFTPSYTGQTFGLGQIAPLTALKTNEIVVKIGRQKVLDYRRPGEIYHAIMDDKTSMHYMAASIRMSIEEYRNIARFDISNNPGITATLFNLGQERQRALSLYHTNVKRLSRGQSLQAPQENYYGWFINSKLKEIQSIL